MSSSVFTCSSLNDSPASTTSVCPSSLRKNTLPSQAHGEEVNAVAAGSIRVL